MVRFNRKAVVCVLATVLFLAGIYFVWMWFGSGFFLQQVASFSDDADIARLLIRLGARTDYRDGEGRTVLHVAAASGNVELTEYLLEQGLDPDSPDWRKHTPLHLAAERGQVGTIELLIRKGADVSAKAVDPPAVSGGEPGERQGFTPLHSAAEAGRVEAIGALVKGGADVNRGTDRNVTPLMIAVTRGHPAAVKALLTHGADASVKAFDGRTAHDIAESIQNPEIAGILKRGGGREP